MSSLQAAKAVLLALLALAVAQTCYYAPLLPEHVASSFSGSGEAQAWSGKTGFFALYLGLLALLGFVFVPLPALRRAALPEGLLAWLAWNGAAHVLLAIVIVQLVIDANLAGEPLSAAFLWLLAGYFVFMVGWLVALFRRFGIRPAG